MPVLSVHAVIVALQNSQIRVHVSDEGTYLKELAVNIDADRSNTSPKWTSLVTRVNSETLSRHLTIQGVDLKQIAPPAKVGEAIVISMLSQDSRLELKMRLEIVPGESLFKLGLEFFNHSALPLELGPKLGLQLGPGLGEYPIGGFGIADILYSYVEPVVYSGEDGLKRFPFDQDSTDSMYDLSAVNWIGIHSRYFALVLMPENQEAPSPARIIPARESTDIPQRYLPTVVLDIGLKTLLPGSKIERNYKVYAGTKSKENLVGNDYDFSELLFPELWQWMRTLSFALLWMLEFLYKLIPNWGFAIICLAVCVRLLMYPLAQRSLKSQQAFMAVQKAMGPELAEIKQNYKGGEQSERILQLYEQHNISPLAGLKPLLLVLIQIPIFVALFNVLGQVFEFRDASFLWIDTLAEPDKLFSLGFEIPLLGAYFNLLPVLMAVSTLLMISMSSPPMADGETRKRKPWGLLLMTFGFFILFYPFPSGMVLYWTMANVLHLVQQWVVGLSVKDLS